MDRPALTVEKNQSVWLTVGMSIKLWEKVIKNGMLKKPDC